MEDVRIVIVNEKNIENPFGEYSGNLTSHLIKHPDLISKEAKFTQAELGIYDQKRLQATYASLRVDLVFEDENNIYLVEVKDDPREVEEGKKQILQYKRIFLGYLRDFKKGFSLTKQVVPVVATTSEQE